MAETAQDVSNGHARIALPEELTIAEAESCYRLFRQSMEQAGDVDVEAAAVTRADAAGIQMLLAVQQALIESGRTLRWHRPSRAFVGAIELLGLSQFLNVPVET
jgi:ABC-type transporter Mla MlaB component